MSFPSPARDYAERSIRLDKGLVKPPHSTIFMNLEVTDMIDAHMPPGSLLAIDRALTASSGDIVILVLGGAFTVRRLVNSESTCRLFPANRHYREQKSTPKMNITIWGVVTQIIIDLQKEKHRSEVRDHQSMEALLDKQYAARQRRYIDRYTTWRARMNSSLKPLAQLIFGELLVVVQYQRQQNQDKVC